VAGANYLRRSYKEAGASHHPLGSFKPPCLIWAMGTCPWLHRAASLFPARAPVDFLTLRLKCRVEVVPWYLLRRSPFVVNLSIWPFGDCNLKLLLLLAECMTNSPSHWGCNLLGRFLNFRSTSSPGRRFRSLLIAWSPFD
jgi:hypothetical protein